MLAFGEVVQLYAEKVSDNDEFFKERQDDYIDNHRFDNAEYDRRELDQFSLSS